MAYIKFENVHKKYIMGEHTINAVNGADFEIEEGEICVIVGASGAGKSTVLNMLGGMDACTEGRIVVDGEEISSYSRRKLTEYRRHDVGFVFQFYNLIQNLTALENVEFASQICKNPLDARDILDKVGLSDRLENFPAQLSGGEQQRVAIARALAKQPKILLCDEPTGALDHNTGVAILSLLQKMGRDLGKTVIIITHNSILTAMADRVIRMKGGKIVSCETNPTPVNIETLEW